MNSTNNNPKEQTNIDQPLLVLATSIIDHYLIRTVSEIGILLNISLAFLLCHKSLKHKLYYFMWCRAICNLVFCLPVMGYVDNCYEFSYKSKWMAYCSGYCLIFLRAFSISSFISDIFFIFNSYFEIEKKPRNFLSLSFNLFIFSIYFIIAKLFCFNVVEGAGKL